jgi:hypothetical protein
MAPGFVTVKTYQNEINAGLDRGILESNGIPAFLVGAPMSNVYGGVGILSQINLLVPQELLDDARNLLDPARAESDQAGESPEAAGSGQSPDDAGPVEGNDSSPEEGEDEPQE